MPLEHACLLRIFVTAQDFHSVTCGQLRNVGSRQTTYHVSRNIERLRKIAPLDELSNVPLQAALIQLITLRCAGFVLKD
jgi:hypothetical protein